MNDELIRDLWLVVDKRDQRTQGLHLIQEIVGVFTSEVLAKKAAQVFIETCDGDTMVLVEKWDRKLNQFDDGE